jgi:uncharacterized protein
VLSAADRTRLEDKLAARERTTGAQMVIAIFPSLEGESLEDVSIRLAEQWKVGHKGVDNGVILLVFLKDRKLRIEVGYGLEPVITDAVSAGIIRDVIAPRFREGRYAAGLEAAVDEIFARIGGGPAPPRARGPAMPKPVANATLLLMLLIFGVFIVAIGSAIRSSLRRGYTVDRGGWRSHPPIYWGGGPWIGGGGGGGGGGGDSGGGFSGGGGSFGGGGASGDW